EAGDELEAEGADVELEAEEPDGKSSTACDLQFFATSMNEFMANMNSGAGGSGGSSGSGRAGGSGGTGRNADGTGVRDAEPTVPELIGCTYATFLVW
nr:hypothetical protein [Tanacetum cinerariifolium]